MPAGYVLDGRSSHPMETVLDRKHLSQTPLIYVIYVSNISSSLSLLTSTRLAVVVLHTRIPLNRCQANLQRTFIPENEDLLSRHPVLALFSKLHVETPDQARENQPHLNIRKAMWQSVTTITDIDKRFGRSYLRPKQLRAPRWKGWNASLLSEANSGSARNLSGRKLKGSLK